MVRARSPGQFSWMVVGCCVWWFVGVECRALRFRDTRGGWDVGGRGDVVDRLVIWVALDAVDFGGGLIHVLAGGTLNRSFGSGRDGRFSRRSRTTARSRSARARSRCLRLTQARAAPLSTAARRFPDRVTLNGGTLAGSGTVDGSVTNNGGTVAPGGSPGILTITGSYTQGAGGTLRIEIDGLTVGTEYDRLAVTGAASLDGTLAIVHGRRVRSAGCLGLLDPHGRRGPHRHLRDRHRDRRQRQDIRHDLRAELRDASG